MNTETYGYDATGALTSRGSGILAAPFTVDGYRRPISSASGIAASWSTDGELGTLTRPSLGQAQFAYDGLGRLKGAVLADGRVADYNYDGAGRRISLRIDGQLMRRYAYGSSLFPRARLDAAGDVLEHYVYASHAHVPDLIVGRDGQKLRLVLDSLGSVRAAVDVSTGAVVQRLSYDAYGQVTQDTAPGTQPFGFKGALTDPAAEGAGLVWMGVRAYVPSLARFATPDPAGLAAGWNEHDALGGDPINLVDADGMMFSRNDASDFSAGVGDLALGLGCLWQCNPGSAARSALGIDDKVDMCGRAYRNGQYAAPFVVAGVIAGPPTLGAAGSAIAARRVARKAANHAWTKHVVKRGEFPEVTNRKDLRKIVRTVRSNPTHSKQLQRGRKASYDENSNTLVIENTKMPERSTVYRPRGGLDAYNELH